MQKTQIRFVRNRTGADKRRKFKFYEICLQCSKLAMTYFSRSISVLRIFTWRQLYLLLLPGMQPLKQNLVDPMYIFMSVF